MSADYITVDRAVVEAVIGQASDHYQKRNGHRASIEGEDGEKCWIVPFDAFENLRHAMLAAASPSEAKGEEMREAIARIVSEAMGEDFGSFGQYWIETPFAEAADAILAALSTPSSDEQGEELAAGKEELRRLLESIWRAEYRKDAPDWKALPDLVGMVTQIDNMYAGVRAQRDAAASPPVDHGALVEALKQAASDFDDLRQFAQQRREDGEEMGASIWRIALDDIKREALDNASRARSALSSLGEEVDD